MNGVYSNGNPLNLQTEEISAYTIYAARIKYRSNKRRNDFSLLLVSRWKPAFVDFQ
jgi:hypothetical protein